MNESHGPETALHLARRLFPGTADNDPLDSLQVMELLAHLERNGFEAPSPVFITDLTIAGVIGAEK
ncbi:hypothetical protein K353_02084 [Kitasatospora sp. SolWspMP-SS2h]|uniref:hypothetical protein n=1 Tax=Kitasatospora sp. SolWspMP-SS2h TaxID=1305729 RepID=UPI000DB96E79|nr:hypothetical protein [Kitasatospora sp. SolWspMP-SS2h]RAJ43069.1 hypothetical protein K353_02084 [Kitasatospora sp. SolWspMP-SS2h]